MIAAKAYLRAIIPLTLLGGAHAAEPAECQIIDALEQAQIPNSTCTTYRTETSRTGVSCHWPFPYRSKDAQVLGETLWQTLTTCRKGHSLGPDAQVNHPDSYALREWATNTGTYALSIKDKGALDQTLVFLRFEPR